MALSISCLVDVPDSYQRQAWYGIRMLFFPFQVTIVPSSGENSESCDLYYGEHPENAPRDALKIGLVEETITYFASPTGKPPIRDLFRVENQDVPIIARGQGDVTIDPIAATFFFLSGWQEFNSTPRDVHGRYLSATSIQHELELVAIPVVEYYRLYVTQLLRQRNIHLHRKTWAGRDWAFCPTHDIDYVRKWRPGILYREVIERALLNRAGESSAQRVNRFFQAGKGCLGRVDPYRHTIERLRTQTVNHGGTGTYFFKTIARDPHDVGYAPASRFLRRQYKALLEAGFEIGLHPSYHAYDNAGHMVEERNLLEEASGVAATAVRTHYLRFRQPVTTRAMVDAGFRIDSSLGFSETVGFRNGTCLPFFHYDIVANKETALLEMPLALMESALFNRESLTLPEATARTSKIMDTCRRFGGVFVGLWHNILWDEEDFPGWGEHFVFSLNQAAHAAANISSLDCAADTWK